MPYDVGVRSYLQGKGVDSGSIGFDQNSGNVTVNNQPFYKPELNMAGTTYSNQSNLDNAYQNYTKSQQPQNSGMFNAASSAAGVDAGAGQGGSSAGNGQGTSGTGQTTQYTNPYTQQIADLMKHLSDTSGAPQQDIYSSPQYAAAQANQARQSQLAVRQANEQAAGAGLGHSTIMTDRSQRIQDDSNNYLQTQLVPQIMSQLQAQRQQELTNQENQLRDYMTLGQQADSQHNADRTYDAGRQDAATTATGIFNPSGLTMDQAQAQMDANSKAYATASPAEKDRLHTENMKLAGLLGKNYDSNTGTYSEGQGFVGTKTVAQKQLDLNNAKDMAILTGKMPDGTPTSAQQQLDLANEWKASETTGVITPKLAEMYKLAPNTPTEAAKQFAQTLNIQQGQLDNSRTATSNALTLGNKNADIAQGNQDLAKANALGTTVDGKQTIDYQTKVQDNLYKIWNETGKAPEGIPGVAKDTPLNSATVQQRELANAYKTWNDTGVAPEGIPGVVPGTPKYNATANNRANFNAKESAVISQFDTVPKANLKAAIQDHKSQIVGQVGQTGYDKIYNSYFDPITGALR